MTTIYELSHMHHSGDQTPKHFASCGIFAQMFCSTNMHCGSVLVSGLSESLQNDMQFKRVLQGVTRLDPDQRVQKYGQFAADIAAYVSRPLYLEVQVLLKWRHGFSSTRVTWRLDVCLVPPEMV